MLAYLLRRLLHMAVVLALLSVLTRALLWAMPGDPVDALRRATPHPLSQADLERLKRHYGYGDPFLVQYGKWVRLALAGDLGDSQIYRLPVSELLRPALRRTLVLMGSAFLVAALLAVPLGVRSAALPGSPDDLLIRLLCYVGISIPSFWLCLVLIQWFAVRWRWFPPDAQIPPDTPGWSRQLSYLVLPVAAVAVQLLAEWTRYIRSGMREGLNADFLHAVRARGASETRVIWRHALPNALIPFLTVLGLSLPYLVGGELVVEMVFGWPGLGQLEYDAIRKQDYNLAMATLLLIAALTLAGSLLADLLHAVLDPRVRHSLSR